MRMDEYSTAAGELASVVMEIHKKTCYLHLKFTNHFHSKFTFTSGAARSTESGVNAARTCSTEHTSLDSSKIRSDT